METEISKYQHVIRAIFDTPWAITPGVLAMIVDLVRFRSEGGSFTAEEIAERLGIAAAKNGPRAGQQRSGLVGVIPVYGLITARQNLLANTSGGTTIDGLAEMFKAAQEDPEVGSIIFDIDSPGGTVEGVEEFAAMVRSYRGGKPIVAVANHQAASAAYWIASAADEIVATPTSMLGSIGIIAAHEDHSVAQENEGVKTTVLSVPAAKADGNRFAPLSDDARADIEGKLDAYYGMFVKALAKGRGTSVENVRKSYGGGRMLMAQEALSAGMVDRIGTLDETIKRLARGGASRPLAAPSNQLQIDGQANEGGSPAGLPFAEHAERLLLDARAFTRRAGEVKALRAEDGRDLSEEARERLRAIAADLTAASQAAAEVAEPVKEPDAPGPTAEPISAARLLDLMELAVERGYPIH